MHTNKLFPVESNATMGKKGKEDKLIHYLDILDMNMLHKLADSAADHIVVGINQAYINSLLACTIWRQYEIKSQNEHILSVIYDCNNNTLTSALGLLKRILAFKKDKSIYFLFKDNIKDCRITMEMLEKVFHYPPIPMHYARGQKYVAYEDVQQINHGKSNLYYWEIQSFLHQSSEIIFPSSCIHQVPKWLEIIYSSQFIIEVVQQLQDEKLWIYRI